VVQIIGMTESIGLKDIREGRGKVTLWSEYDGKTVLNLAANEYLEVPSRLNILPLKRGYFPGDSPSRKFLKYGLHARIHDLDSREEAANHYEQGIGFQDRIEAIVNAAAGPQRGICWTSFRDRRHRVARFVDMVEAVELLACIDKGKLPAPRIDKLELELQNVVDMPSRSDDDKYNFVLRPMPVKESENPAADAFDLRADCHCEDSQFHSEANRRYKGGEDLMCAHIAAAFGLAAESRTSNTVVQNPFAVPREKMIRLKEKVAKQTIIVKRDRQGKDFRESPTKAEVEALLWIAMKEVSYREMFYRDDTARKMIEAAGCIKV
jgi:hypothetical protein